VGHEADLGRRELLNLIRSKDNYLEELGKLYGKGRGPLQRFLEEDMIHHRELLEHLVEQDALTWREGKVRVFGCLP